MKELDILKVLRKKKRVEKEKKLLIKTKKKPLFIEENKAKKKSKLKKIYLDDSPSVTSKQSSIKNISESNKMVSRREERTEAVSNTNISLKGSQKSQDIAMSGSSSFSNINSLVSSFSSSSYTSGNFSNYSNHSSFSNSNYFSGAFSKEADISSFLNDSNKTKKEVKVVVTTNFMMAGRRQADGSRATKEAVGSHSSAALNYIENHGSRDLEEDNELSNIYDETGDRVSKDDFYELRKSLEKDGEISAFRRVVISPKEDLTRDEMKDLTLKTFQEFQEQTGKDLSFKFAIHTDTENIHSHIVITGSNSDINFSKEQLGMFKDISHNVSKEIEQERSLEKSISKQLGVSREINKDIEQEI